LPEIRDAVIQRRDMPPQLDTTTAGMDRERVLWLKKKFYDEIEVEIKIVDLLLNHIKTYGEYDPYLIH
jgi:hypothetical protein